jgi:hypothetical protein
MTRATHGQGASIRSSLIFVQHGSTNRSSSRVDDLEPTRQSIPEDDGPKSVQAPDDAKNAEHCGRCAVFILLLQEPCMFKPRTTLIALFVLLPSFATVAQTRRPIAHEDVWLMKRVGAPVPSPDGKWLAFSVIEPAYDEKDQVTDLWIAPGDGSAKPRRLTATRGAESGAVWSP